MKKTFVYFLLSFALVGTFSCETDSFLEDPKPTDEVSDDVVTPDLALVGMYSAYRDFYGGSHDVATSKSFYLGAEVMGRDLQVPDFNWYIFEHRWDVVESAQARRTYYSWEMNYKLIFHANQVLHICDTNPAGLGEDVLNNYRGQALALRANAYYNLIRSFQFTYAKNPSLPGVPIDISLDSNHKSRGTVQQVYDQMYADMNDALSLLSSGAPRLAMHKYRVDLNVAKGLFARIALEKRDWALAASLASEARQGYNLMGNADYTAGFNDFGNAEWMWGFPYINSENFGFASFYSFIDHERGDGYKDIYVNSSFYNLFSATDVRRTLIVPGAPAPGKQWVTRKFRDLPDLSGHMVMMRASEMYLIQAEGLAYSDLSAAKQVLLQLAQQRDPNATLSSAATAAAFVEEVLVERRKELYGELGTDFFDMKRYQKDMTRTGNAVWNAVGFAVGQTVPATSNKWNLLIPQEEIDLNDAIGPEDQNPLD